MIYFQKKIATTESQNQLHVFPSQQHHHNLGADHSHQHVLPLRGKLAVLSPEEAHISRVRLCRA